MCPSESTVTATDHKPNGEAAQGAVETSWSWVVLMATFCNAVVIMGQHAAGSIYYVVFLREFGASKAYTAWILAAFNTAICVAAPLASVLLPRMGPRFMIFFSAIAYAISLILISMATSIPYIIVLFAVNGTATTITQSAQLAAISMYFPRRFYLATGLMYAGVGFGALIIGLEVEWAIKEFGWRGAMLIQAGLVLQGCVGSSLVFPVKTSAKRTSSPTNKTANGPLVYFKDLRFWLLVMCLLTMYLILSIMGSIVKSVIISYGLEEYFWLCLIVIGLAQIIGRALTGFIAQHCLCPPLYYAVISFGLALTGLGLIYARYPWAIVTASFAYSFFQGQQIVINFLQIAWVYGNQQAAIVRGYVFLFSIVASMSGAPIAGWTADLTNSYDVALIISMSSALLSAVGSILIYVTHRRQTAQVHNECVPNILTQF